MSASRKHIRRLDVCGMKVKWNQRTYRIEDYQQTLYITLHNVTSGRMIAFEAEIQGTPLTKDYEWRAERAKLDADDLDERLRKAVEHSGAVTEGHSEAKLGAVSDIIHDFMHRQRNVLVGPERDLETMSFSV